MCERREGGRERERGARGGGGGEKYEHMEVSWWESGG